MGARKVTSKQLGDAIEMLVAAELTLAGCPAYLAGGGWPGHDVMARLQDGKPQRISVKARTYKSSGQFVAFTADDEFDWLAIVVLPAPGLANRRIFIVPRRVAITRSYDRGESGKGRGFFVHKVIERPPSRVLRGDVPPGGWGLGDFENNFSLSKRPLPH